MLDGRTSALPVNPYVISCRWSLSITPEETLENLRFSNIFRVYRKRPLAWNGLIKIRNRSSHQRCSAKKVLLKISQVSQESSVLEFLFNKVAGLQACNFIKKKLQHRFSCKICEIFKTTYFEETSMKDCFSSKGHNRMNQNTPC